jgi:hypothetical protein
VAASGNNVVRLFGGFDLAPLAARHVAAPNITQLLVVFLLATKKNNLVVKAAEGRASSTRRHVLRFTIDTVSDN